MPSIAYRMARVAAGDGPATVSVHGVNEYDIAAGMALIAAAKGVVLDAEGRDIVLQGNVATRVTGVFAGAPEAARQLAKFAWARLEQEPRRDPRVALRFPRKSGYLERAQGVLLGQVIGDSLGSRVEFKSAAEIGKLFPGGVRELADGGPYHTIAGQPTDDSEMALTLARAILRNGGFERDKVLDAYREWLQTRPIDIGETTERGLLGLHTTESESNGSLMRVSPIGVWAAGDPARAAAAAREDSALTHPNPVCVEACAGLCAAIAAGVAGASRKEMVQAAAAHCTGLAREAIQRNALPGNFDRGWAITALQNAFYRLASKESVEESLVATVGCGGERAGSGLDQGRLYEVNTTVLEDGSHGPMLCLGGIATSLPPQCGDVPITAWNWRAVEGEEALRGTTWGRFHVVGSYDGENFTPSEVGPYEEDASGSAQEIDFASPCEEPEGGWRGRDHATQVGVPAVDAYARSQPDYVSSWITHLDPSAPARGPVVFNAVFTGDAERHEAEIEKLWSGPRCVLARDVASARELSRIRSEVEAGLHELGLRMLWSSSEGPSVEPTIEIGVVIDVDGKGQAAFDARYGPGMVRVTSALKPAS
jgi:ADP-ribosylglycohydrolase